MCTKRICGLFVVFAFLTVATTHTPAAVSAQSANTVDVCPSSNQYPDLAGAELCAFSTQITRSQSPNALADIDLNQPDLNVAYIQQLPRYDYTAEKNQHAPGDLVTFVAFIANRGNQPTSEFNYLWQLDDVVVAGGSAPSLAPDEMTQLTHTWTWESGPHSVALSLDPDNQIAELSEQNNRVIDQTNALAIGFWVEQSVYDWFNENQIALGLGSVSWDDWAQRQVSYWNEIFAAAIHPLTPGGIVERVRLDKVVILADGSWPDCHNTFVPEDRTVDLVWGFISESVGVPSGHSCGLLNFYQIYPQFQTVELPLLHEMSHARYLVDLYGLNVYTNHAYLTSAIGTADAVLPMDRTVGTDSAFPVPAYLAVDGELILCQSKNETQFVNCQRGVDGTSVRPHAASSLVTLATVRIQDGAGNLVQGSPALPVVGAFDDHLYFNRYANDDLMGGGGAAAYGQHSAYAWNRIVGQRPICGNYNAPCNLGEYLNDIPASNVLAISDQNGVPIAGAEVALFQAKPMPYWYGRYFPAYPDQAVYTDAAGLADLGAFPFGPDPQIVHYWGYSNAVLLLRIAVDGQVIYRFFEVTEANEAYWSGQQIQGVYPITIEVEPEPVADVVYISTISGALTAPGEIFASDEDILAYDFSTGEWSLYFDGSDLGLRSIDVDAIHVAADGTILMSFDLPWRLAGLGQVDDSDIVRFVPTSLGDNTAGSWELYFDGSDVGLTREGEDVDAIGFAPDGRLLISTNAAAVVPATTGWLNANDEDLLVFEATALGKQTVGTFFIYFRGGDVMLSPYDVRGTWVDPNTGEIYLTVNSQFNLPTVSGYNTDIFVCQPIRLGVPTDCTFASELYLDGRALSGFIGGGLPLDGFSLAAPE